jgi:hypothetical protein
MRECQCSGTDKYTREKCSNGSEKQMEHSEIIFFQLLAPSPAQSVLPSFNLVILCLRRLWAWRFMFAKLAGFSSCAQRGDVVSPRAGALVIWNSHPGTSVPGYRL